MKGSYDVRIENARVQFKLRLARNLTIIRGMSATGKSTLVGLVAEYEANGRSSGITLSSPKRCRVLAGRSWRRDLEEIDDSFVFIDEGNEFLFSNEFAESARSSDNYYVIVTRESLPILPYSVEEVYELRNTTSRYPGIKKFYTHTQRMYSPIPTISNPEIVIVEDSNAGFEFFSALCARSGIECASARGKGNVLAEMRRHTGRRVLVIADGAAFGPQMDMVLAQAKRMEAGLFLPESFEWLILNSGLVKDDEVTELLADPSSFIDSRDYFSWERFFNATLVARTRGTYLAYTKRRLNPAYLGARETAAIETGLEGTGLLPERPH